MHKSIKYIGHCINLHLKKQYDHSVGNQALQHSVQNVGRLPFPGLTSMLSPSLPPVWLESGGADLGGASSPFPYMYTP
jgi:hypothetical protein